MNDKLKGILAGIVVFSSVVGGLILALYLLSLVFSMPAQAGEKPKWLFPEPPYVFLGLEAEVGDTFCISDRQRFQDKIVSNGGIGQKILKGNRWSTDVTYRHHSCGFATDRNSYDGFGIQFIYSPWAKK